MGRRRILVLSMNDEIGRARRARLGYSFDWIGAIRGSDVSTSHPIVRRMKHYWNAGEKVRLGKIGCFATWISVLRYIERERIDNVVVVEDDCQLTIPREIFDKLDLGDEICYVNGRIAHPRTWHANREFLRTDAYRLIREMTRNGGGVVDVDYEKFRMLGTWGLYFPTHDHARRLCDDLLRPDRYTHVDIHIAKHRLIRKMYFPSLFEHDDRGVSTIYRPFGRYRNYVRVVKEGDGGDSGTKGSKR